MARNTNGIATIGDIVSGGTILNGEWYFPNETTAEQRKRCPTCNELTRSADSNDYWFYGAPGLVLYNSYAGNQLVKYEDIGEETYTLTISNWDDFANAYGLDSDTSYCFGTSPDYPLNASNLPTHNLISYNENQNTIVGSIPQWYNFYYNLEGGTLYITHPDDSSSSVNVSVDNDNLISAVDYMLCNWDSYDFSLTVQLYKDIMVNVKYIIAYAMDDGSNGTFTVPGHLLFNYGSNPSLDGSITGTSFGATMRNFSSGYIILNDVNLMETDNVEVVLMPTSYYGNDHTMHGTNTTVQLYSGTDINNYFASSKMNMQSYPYAANGIQLPYVDGYVPLPTDGSLTTNLYIVLTDNNNFTLNPFLGKVIITGTTFGYYNYEDSSHSVFYEVNDDVSQYVNINQFKPFEDHFESSDGRLISIEDDRTYYYKMEFVLNQSNNPEWQEGYYLFAFGGRGYRVRIQNYNKQLLNNGVNVTISSNYDLFMWDLNY